MIDLMVDIETFGTNKNSCIIQIGACYFDRGTGKIGEKFIKNIDARDACKQGAEMDADTVYWWLSQSKEAIESITKPPLESLKYVLQKFKSFADPVDRIWSHSNFDFVLIQDALRMVGLKPLPYRNSRDIRTLTDLAKVSYTDFKREGTHHNALDDAIFQVRYCVSAFQSLDRK